MLEPLSSAFIHDHQAFGVHLLHLLTPLGTLFLTTFTGTQCLFLRVQPMCLMGWLIVVVLTCTPCICSKTPTLILSPQISMRLQLRCQLGLQMPYLFGWSSRNSFGHDGSRVSPLFEVALDGRSGHA